MCVTSTLSLRDASGEWGNAQEGESCAGGERASVYAGESRWCAHGVPTTVGGQAHALEILAGSGY